MVSTQIEIIDYPASYVPANTETLKEFMMSYSGSKHDFYVSDDYTFSRLDYINDREKYFDAGVLWIMPTEFSVSDYHGDIIYKANAECIKKDFADVSGIAWDIEKQAYHGESIAFNLSHLSNELISIINSLNDYPVLDEMLLSSIELEAQAESWDAGYSYDFKRHLESIIEGWLDTQEPTLFDTDNIYDAIDSYMEYFGVNTEESLLEFFNEMCSTLNIYWSTQYNEAQIDINHICKGTTMTELKAFKR